MGRAKSNMELIKKDKLRHSTFHQRKISLKKKAYELATLCDIKVMMIINGPKQATHQARPLESVIFPDNRDEVLELINKYKGQSSEDRKKRTSLLSNFFQERNQKARQVLARLRKTHVHSKYPTWDSRFNDYTEKDLRSIAAFLENTIENAKAKLEQMKASNNNKYNIYNAYLQQKRMLTNEGSMDFQAGNHTNKPLFTIDPHHAGFMRVPVPMPMPIQQQKLTFMDYYQDQRMVRFGRDYAGGATNMVYNAPPSTALYGGATNMVHNAHPSTTLYNYPTMAETVDSTTYVNNLVREPPNNHDERWQPIAHQHMEYHPMRPGSNPHQMVATSHQVDARAQFDENRKYYW